MKAGTSEVGGRFRPEANLRRVLASISLSSYQSVILEIGYSTSILLVTQQVSILSAVESALRCVFSSLP